MVQHLPIVYGRGRRLYNMTTFNEKLKAAKKEFDGGAHYDKPSMREVLDYCKQAQAADGKKYYYNRALADYIKEREQVDADMADYLDTEVYLAQHDIRGESKAAHEAEMIAAGWRKLDKAAVDDALAQGMKLEVNATASNDWFEVKVERVYKPHIFGDGQYGLMKPKARTHGYALHQFDNAFCRLV